MDVAAKLGIIDALQSRVDKLFPLKDWHDAFLRKVKIDFTYNSNKLEGNTLTYGQTIKLLRDFVTPKNATSAEALAMINHQKILDIVFNNYRLQNIT